MRIGGGVSMLKALWRMAEINTTPVLSAGVAVPSNIQVEVLTPIEHGSSDEHAFATAPSTLDVFASPPQPDIPTVINFGSCS